MLGFVAALIRYMADSMASRVYSTFISFCSQ